MDRHVDHHLIERGIALHKMIRLLTLSAGGEGYMTFIGNEFGHPEWLDFPREGNGWSYHYARRQWGLVDDPNLRYMDLAHFEQAFLALEKKLLYVVKKTECVRLDHEGKVLAFLKGDLLFVFNFSINDSYEESEIYLPEHGSWKVILDSDASEFGGKGRLDHSKIYQTVTDPVRVKLSLPHRSVQVLIQQ